MEETVTIRGREVSASELTDLPESELDDFEASLVKRPPKEKEKVERAPPATYSDEDFDEWDIFDDDEGSSFRSRGRSDVSLDSPRPSRGRKELKKSVSPIRKTKRGYSRGISLSPDLRSYSTKRSRSLRRHSSYSSEESVSPVYQRREPPPYRKSPSPKKNRTKELYKAKKEPAGVDWRGVPYVEEMGMQMPYFRVIDRSTCDMLRAQMINQQRNVTIAYKDISFRQYDENDYDCLPAMFYETAKGCELALARNNAAAWKQYIWAGSAVVEQACIIAGFDKAKGMAESHVYVMPIYESLILEVAEKRGGGVVAQYFSPELKIASIVVGSSLLFLACGYFAPMLESKTTERFKKAFDSINGVVGTFQRGFGGGQASPAQQAPQAAPQPSFPQAPGPPPAEIPVAGVQDLFSAAAPVIDGIKGLFSSGTSSSSKPKQTSTRPGRRGRRTGLRMR